MNNLKTIWKHFSDSQRYFMLALLTMLVLALVTFALQVLYFFYAATISLTTVNIVVKPGTNFSSLAANLSKNGTIKQPLLFTILARFSGKAETLQAGEYQLEPGLTSAQILNKFLNSNVTFRAFTIVEGTTFSDLKSALDHNEHLTHTIDTLSDNEIMSAIGHVNENAEGRFYPETYFFTAGSKDITVLKRAYTLMQKKMQLAWQTKTADAPYSTPYEALIVASIVEKESACKEERPKIAGVILKRLQKNMPLQVDPTVTYGLFGSYSGHKLMASDLKIMTPYNTYLRRGLPLTPIAMPSESSIRAALQPEIGDDLYYVAKQDGSGSHQFSKTLAEQDAAIKKYLLSK